MSLAEGVRPSRQGATLQAAVIYADQLRQLSCLLLLHR